mmetsp:Transcript_16335/g.41422  ORF Transcript_16335/g.41422 Transcript_16335/m.41422 type:complete len:444 (-) Transcript_16335:117-1448(-)
MPLLDLLFLALVIPHLGQTVNSSDEGKLSGLSSSALPTGIWMKRVANNPIISNKTSEFLYNYNCANLPTHISSATCKSRINHSIEGSKLIPDSDGVCLAVRVQNLVANAASIYDVGPSYLSLACSVGRGDFDPVLIDNVFGSAEQGWSDYAVEDPRIALLPDGSYALFYSNVSKLADGSGLAAQLALATSPDVTSAREGRWQVRGNVFPTLKWSKSGALLVLNSEEGRGKDTGWREENSELGAGKGGLESTDGRSVNGYLFWGDKNITVATTSDFVEYTNTEKVLLSPREGYFDSVLVEAGPPPMRLSSGDYLFLYNSATQPNPPLPNRKPDWKLQYNIGYAILDGNDPTLVKYRSRTPLFSPTLEWEKCSYPSPSPLPRGVGLTPYVVFVEGWERVCSNIEDGQEKDIEKSESKMLEEKDVFTVWYQGCDSVIGKAILTVQW